MHRNIIHLDLDAFFCAVEELRVSSLRGKPFAVGGKPEERGVVASCSYAARKFGVRSAMPMARAKRLCPALIIISGHRRDYGEKSRQVMEILKEATPLVEQLSIDEAFLDVSELGESGERLAQELQRRIRDEAQLPASLGVATNKLVAKIASDVGKTAKKTDAYPNAITVVPPGKEAEFLAPLPIESLWGIGPKTAKQLGDLGIHTIGQLAEWPVQILEQRFGQNGRDLSVRAKGVDDRPVVTFREAKSISQEETFSRDISDGETLRKALREQSTTVAKSLQKANLLGGTVKLKLRWPDFTTITRQVALPEPSDQGNAIYKAALSLFERAWKRGWPVRLIGVGVSNLQPPSRQLTLWDAPKLQRRVRLDEAMDVIQEKFGEESIRRGTKKA